MVLEEIGEDVEPARRVGERLLGAEIGAVRQREALLAFDEIGPARKAARREPRRQQAVLRRLAGMERLAHRAELRLQPGGLRAGDAERARGGLGVEAEQAGAGRRGAETADRAGRVKAEIVMARAHRRADPAGGLVAGDKGGDHVAPAALALLGEGEQAGQDRDRRMARHRQVDVVVVERVPDRAVDQRGRQHRQPRRMADQAGLRMCRRLRSARRAASRRAGRRPRRARRRNNRARIAGPARARRRAGRHTTPRSPARRDCASSPLPACGLPDRRPSFLPFVARPAAFRRRGYS